MSAVPIQEWALVLSDSYAVYTDNFPDHPTTFIRKLNAYVNPNEGASEVFIKRDGKFYLAQKEPYFSHYEPRNYVNHKIAYDPLQNKRIEIVP
jgi:hypothetical protein